MEFNKERSRRQHLSLKRNQKSKEISAHNYLTCLININQGFFSQDNLSSQHFPWYFLNDIILLQLFRCKKYESKYADIFINKNALLYNFQTFCSSLNCFVFCKILFAQDMIAFYFCTYTALKNKTWFFFFCWTKFSNGHRIALTECWWILLVFCTLVNIISK